LILLLIKKSFSSFYFLIFFLLRLLWLLGGKDGQLKVERRTLRFLLWPEPLLGDWPGGAFAFNKKATLLLSKTL